MEVASRIVSKANAIRDRANRWFNEIALNVLPQTTFERRHVNVLLRRVTAAVLSNQFYEEQIGVTRDGAAYTQHDVEHRMLLTAVVKEAAATMEEALRLVRTAPSIQAARLSAKTASHVSNTAFILMWMDPERPELVDVHEAVKEVFDDFGISAERADDIQHSDRITDVVLDQIARAEFLFADLSGERPNVYYEVGYAHALGKRPILYRRSGTPLHFDLSVHNVPEYGNITELKALLRERLSAITGRTPKAR